MTKNTGEKTALPEPKWADLIRKKRKELHETQSQFGQRFGVSATAVHYWENGLAEAPYAVTWWLTHEGVSA